MASSLNKPVLYRPQKYSCVHWEMQSVLRGQPKISYHQSQMKMEEELIEGAEPHFTGQWRQNDASCRWPEDVAVIGSSKSHVCFKHNTGA